MEKKFSLDRILKSPASPLIFVFLLAIAIVITFSPALQGGFLSWDDDHNLTRNSSLLQGELTAFWQQPYFGMYIPLTYSAWSLFHKLVGLDPTAFHALNLVIHFFNACLVFLIFQKILQLPSKWPSIFLAVLFAIHPLQVESVAWVSGFRDLLSAFLGLVSVIASFSRLRWARVVSPLLFGLALLCKPAIISLPIALWIYRTNQEPRLYLQNAARMLPWVLISLPVFWITANTQSIATHFEVDWEVRPLVMMDSFGFYVQKFLFPISLNLDYGRSPRWLLDNIETSFLPSLLCLSLVVLAIAKKTKRAWQLPALIYFALLLPVSGLVKFAFQDHSTVTDHYAYLALPCLGWGLCLQFENWRPGLVGRRGLGVGALFCLALFSLLSFQRSHVWQNDRALFASILANNPNSFIAHTGLGNLALNAGDLESAKLHFFEAYEIRPRWLTSISNKYLILQKLGQRDQVIQLNPQLDDPSFRQAGDANPQTFSDLLVVVAAALYENGQLIPAFERTCLALKYNSENSLAARNMETIQKHFSNLQRHAECPK